MGFGEDSVLPGARLGGAPGTLVLPWFTSPALCCCMLHGSWGGHLLDHRDGRWPCDQEGCVRSWVRHLQPLP